jgi:hypothetical protein
MALCEPKIAPRTKKTPLDEEASVDGHQPGQPVKSSSAGEKRFPPITERQRVIEGGLSAVDSLLAPIKSVDGLHQQKNIGFPIDKPAIPDMMRGISHNGFTTDHVLVGSRNVSCSQTAINIRVPLRHLWGTNGDQGDFGFSNWVHHLGAYCYCC